MYHTIVYNKLQGEQQMKYQKICIRQQTLRLLSDYKTNDEEWSDVIDKMIEHIEDCDSLWCEL